MMFNENFQMRDWRKSCDKIFYFIVIISKYVNHPNDYEINKRK